MSQPEQDLTICPYNGGFSGTRRDILRAIDCHRTPPSGQEIVRWLSARYESELSNAVIYPNLEWLKANGLIEKRSRSNDDRANEYLLTNSGRELLEGVRALDRE